MAVFTTHNQNQEVLVLCQVSWQVPPHQPGHVWKSFYAAAVSLVRETAPALSLQRVANPLRMALRSSLSSSSLPCISLHGIYLISMAQIPDIWRLHQKE